MPRANRQRDTNQNYSMDSSSSTLILHKLKNTLLSIIATDTGTQQNYSKDVEIRSSMDYGTSLMLLHAGFGLWPLLSMMESQVQSERKREAYNIGKETLCSRWNSYSTGQNGLGCMPCCVFGRVVGVYSTT